MIDKKPSLEELKHHGVKGMRWGVRKEEVGAAIRRVANTPNPLYYKNVRARIGKDASPSSKNKEQTGFRNFNVSTEKAAKREAKAKKFETKSAKLQERIDAGNKQLAVLDQNKTLFNRVKMSHIRDQQKILEDAKNSADAHAQAKREGRLTPTQKKLLIGGAVVGGLVVAGIAAKQLNSGELRQNIIRGREFITGKEFKFKEAPELKGNWSADQIRSLVVSDINRGYPTEIGSGMNCRRCTFAYELRRRGLDVAATRTPTGEGQHVIGLFNALDTQGKDLSLKEGMRVAEEGTSVGRRIMSMAKKSGSANAFDTPDPIEIFSRLSREPERSRGELGVFWSAGGGHSMAYEIINGVPHIFDCQTGEVYNNPSKLLNNLPDMAQAGFTRLDNVDLDTKFLRRWVKNVK